VMEEEYRVTNKKAEEIAAEWGFSNVKVREAPARAVADRAQVCGADAEEEDEVPEARAGEGETGDSARPRASSCSLQGSLPHPLVGLTRSLARDRFLEHSPQLVAQEAGAARGRRSSSNGSSARGDARKPATFSNQTRES